MPNYAHLLRNGVPLLGRFDANLPQRGAIVRAHARVKNEQSASIKVLRFKYWVKDKPGDYFESLSNKRLAPGETEEWPTQALREAGEGNLITNTWVEYKRDNSGAGDGYGPPKWSKPFPHSSTYTCLNGGNYWLAARQDD